MASPQIENGHTKIANELLEAIYKINLGPYESRVLWCIIRKTYGWNKKMDRISNSQISKETGMARPHVSRALSQLSERVIITRTGNSTLALNKDYTQWLPKQVTRKELPKEVTTITRTGNKSLPARAPQKTVKTLSKDTLIGRVQEKYPTFSALDYDAAESWIDSYNTHNKKKRDVNLAFLLNWAKRNCSDTVASEPERGLPEFRVG